MTDPDDLLPEGLEDRLPRQAAALTAAMLMKSRRRTPSSPYSATVSGVAAPVVSTISPALIQTCLVDPAPADGENPQAAATCARAGEAPYGAGLRGL